MSNTTRYEPGDGVIFQTVAKETVIINLKNGRYYSLNPTASAIWEELVRQASAGEVRSLLDTHEDPHSDTVLNEIVQFIKELVAEELLRPALPGATRLISNAHAPEPVRFETPTLEKYTDMEELIPLDPIHQVGTLGWPHRLGNEPDQTA